MSVLAEEQSEVRNSSTDAPPAVELHLHLEGALSAERALQWYLDTPGAEAPKAHYFAYADGRPFALGDPPHPRLRWHYSDLMGFLYCFGWASQLLRSASRYVTLLDDLAASLRAQNVRYAELFVAIGQMHHARIDPDRILPALAERAAEIEAMGGPTLLFIADSTRQWGVPACQKVLDSALRLQEHRIVGFGMGGDETAIRAREFKAIYRRAAEAGLGLSCHAGEGTSADAVREVVEELDVRRVGHGIAAVQDPRLLAELAAAEVVLEVCPNSNLRTGAWKPADGAHPLFALDAAGIRIVLGSDDPGYFDTDLRREEEWARRAGASEERIGAWQEFARAARFPRSG